MTHLTLIGSLTSPYVRKIRILLSEKQLPYDWVVDDVWSENPQVNAHNPLGQVPCLLVNRSEIVVDSRVISEYLEQLAPMHLPQNADQRIQALKWAALAEGLVDAAVRYRLEQMRPAEYQWSVWFERQMGKLRAGLALMNERLNAHPWLANDAYGIADIGLGCTLGYIDFRMTDWDWRGAYPALAQYYERLMQREAFTATIPQ